MKAHLFESSERLDTGCLSDHGVTVPGAGLQGQGQARDGVDTQLRDGNLVVCDGEYRLAKHRVHRQRRLDLQRERKKKKCFHLISAGQTDAS